MARSTATTSALRVPRRASWADAGKRVIPLILLLAAVGGLMQAATRFSTNSTAGTELAFGYLLLGAYFTAKIINRLGFPKLTGYLAAGAVSGPTALGLVSPHAIEALKVVSDTATAILALEAGSELDLKKVRSVAAMLRGMTLYAVIGAMIAIAGVLFALRSSLDIFAGMSGVQTAVVCAVIGVALSAQSPAVAMAMLAEVRADGPLSRVILASVVVADLTVIVVFSVALAITGGVLGGAIDVQGTALDVAWELLGSMAFGVAIGMLIGVFLRTVHKGAPLFALMVCVVVAEIGSRMHLDPLIIMLASGIWLRNFSRADAAELLHNFEAAQLPVFLVFFALAGAKLHLKDLVAKLPVVAAVAATRAVTFFLGSRLAARRSRAEPVIARYAWVGLVPQAGLALALATVLAKTFSGKVYGEGSVAAFGDRASTLLVGVVALNEMIAPIILRFVLMRSGEAGKKQGVDFAVGQ